ncbi:hypothetical protein [Amycolatopsis alkalitolerans]|uniref:Uncharacterized protein n=1 Tax=Amycolatopsis alkalitolerans TaxID=2547244 RepID=A0A5C4LS52_9PSEU|nr:hypothetical protein [Amycolatopsis alkalitolerans]TNC19088.1 hypothetical protein FG385_33015 [Amycolatopsis alkalitolerans]
MSIESRAMSAEQLSRALTKWKADCDNPFIVAAVTLVQEHEGWLYRADFRESCVYVYGARRAAIRWSHVKDFLEAGPRASTSELSILEFACALAQDRYSWSVMGPAHREFLRRAVSTALGEL